MTQFAREGTLRVPAISGPTTLLNNKKGLKWGAYVLSTMLIIWPGYVPVRRKKICAESFSNRADWLGKPP
jgi:hypothetical protein